jgi:hypothetical protein
MTERQERAEAMLRSRIDRCRPTRGVHLAVIELWLGGKYDDVLPSVLHKLDEDGTLIYDRVSCLYYAPVPSKRGTVGREDSKTRQQALAALRKEAGD